MTFTPRAATRRPVVSGAGAPAVSQSMARPAPVSRRRGLIGRRGRGVALHLLLGSVGILYLLPIIYMVLRALSPWEFSLQGLRERGLTFDNFRALQQDLDIGRVMLNTTVVTIARVAIQVGLSVTAGFAIACIRFVGSRFALVALVSSLMMPFALMLIPLVLMIRVTGFYNSFVGLIAPTLVSGVGVLLFVQVFRRLPTDLIDAARVDGCAPWRVLWHVAVPYARSAIGAFALLVAIYSWNEFLWASVATTGRDRELLTVGVAKLADQHGWSDPGVQMAAACITTLPIIILAVLLRKLSQASHHQLATNGGSRTTKADDQG